MCENEFQEEKPASHVEEDALDTLEKSLNQKSQLMYEEESLFFQQSGKTQGI